MGATGAWYGIAVSNALTAVVAAAGFLCGGWQRNAVETRSDVPSDD